MPKMTHALPLTLVLALAGLSIPPGGARAQTPGPKEPSLSEALARLQADDPEGASSILEKLVAREPENGRAWRILGQARQRRKDPDGAIEAWRKALEVEPGMKAPLYSIGMTYASKKDLEHAYEWLSKAKASGKIDMTQVEISPDLALLKTDARFPTLLPAAKDFADPFVEPVKIIREWGGEASNDQFGWIARNIGDVDGDGVNDVATSAPTKDVAGKNAGRVYVYSTKSGKVLWSADGHPGDQLGNGIEAAGDTNRDGVPDVIAGAPGGGYAKVYSGRDGRVLFTFQAEDKTATRTSSWAPGSMQEPPSARAARISTPARTERS